MRRLSLAVSAFLLVASVLPGDVKTSQLSGTHLRCEYRTNPLGLDVVQPRLSWVLESDDASAREVR